MKTCAFTHEYPRTRRCTIHPRTLTTAFPHTSGSVSRNCSYLLSRISGCALLNLCCSTKNGWWQLLVVAGLGDSGERRAVGQVGGFHRQRPWVAKQQCSSTCCCNQARRPVATSCRWEPTAFDAGALGRDPRVHRGGTWANFSENRVTSLHGSRSQFSHVLSVKSGAT